MFVPIISCELSFKYLFERASCLQAEQSNRTGQQRVTLPPPLSRANGSAQTSVASVNRLRGTPEQHHGRRPIVGSVAPRSYMPTNAGAHAQGGFTNVAFGCRVPPHGESPSKLVPSQGRHPHPQESERLTKMRHDVNVHDVQVAPRMTAPDDMVSRDQHRNANGNAPSRVGGAPPGEMSFAGAHFHGSSSLKLFGTSTSVPATSCGSRVSQPVTASLPYTQTGGFTNFHIPSTAATSRLQPFPASLMPSLQLPPLTAPALSTMSSFPTLTTGLHALTSVPALSPPISMKEFEFSPPVKSAAPKAAAATSLPPSARGKCSIDVVVLRL